MSTKLNDLIPILICEDVQKSIDFYCRVRDFEVADRMDDVGKTSWASLRNGHVQIMLGSPTYLPKPKKTTENTRSRFTISTRKMWPALRDSIIAKNEEVSELRVRFYGMKEFEMPNPDGHMLLFGQDTDEAPTPE